LFDKLWDHKLFLKRSKCFFGELSMSYLGHIISTTGVAMDYQKVQAVLSWPVPTMVCAFLCLDGYYRWFIHDYGAS
jgi:hypothetical protein